MESVLCDLGSRAVRDILWYGQKFSSGSGVCCHKCYAAVEFLWVEDDMVNLVDCSHGNTEGCLTENEECKSRTS